jgi:Co/Zn/Cd efflux system component
VEHCCHANETALAELWSRQVRTLSIVLAINSAMFLAEVIAALAAGSVALLADSLDMLGDALVYGFSLYVVGRSKPWRAGAALLKGALMLLFGLGVLAEIIWKLMTREVPIAPLMGMMGLVALAANGLCLYLLTRHRHDDLNMRSTWLCSRNDIVANLGVLLAAAGVYWFHAIWPDVVVSLVITVLFICSAAEVVRDSWREMREAGLGAAH